ncbi:hypothetical protein PTTG_06789 [Puccinia triticina 1-1 BBBD Race 1]|uniref:Uncharacterized protein n=1 Tax=Puccinia triticina (isolate 1-1 / race 1 (BBBD)) TaxID=630390 RepID=A0A180GG18_PUCT1|nr:hypothetical protein PTTG_06789 [Puccinia triticina 1-1 BBBD Race 1]
MLILLGSSTLGGIHPSSREEPPNNANGGFYNPGFENQHSNPSREETPKQVKSRRKRLDPSIVESLKHLEVDQLRQKVNAHARYKHLTADDRCVFTKAYNKYQKEIHVMAAERLLRLNPVLKHLGNRGCFRGSTMYNNFCEYDVEARKLFYNYDLHQDNQKRECGRLWKNLNQAEKEQYKDLAFLALLPNPFGRGDCNGPDGGTSEASCPKTREITFSSRLRLSTGAKSPRTREAKFVSGGRFLGEQFINMFLQDKKTNIEMNFLLFVGGQEVIRRATGQLAQVTKPRKTCKRKVGAPKSPWNFGGKGANYKAARDKLNLAISKATNGLHKQWPGKTTAATLKKLWVTFSIKDNKHGIKTTHFCVKPGAMRDKQLRLILRVFHKDLVVLTELPAADAPKTLGADPDNLPTGQEATQSSRTTLNKGSATNAKNARGSDSATKSKKGFVSDNTKTASKESIKDKSLKKKQKKLTVQEEYDDEEEDKDKDEDKEDKEDKDNSGSATLTIAVA